MLPSQLAILPYLDRLIAAPTTVTTSHQQSTITYLPKHNVTQLTLTFVQLLTPPQTNRRTPTPPNLPFTIVPVHCHHYCPSVAYVLFFLSDRLFVFNPRLAADMRKLLIKYN